MRLVNASIVLATVAFLLCSFSVQIAQSDLSCDPSTCGGWTFYAKTFYGQESYFCWTYNDTLIFGCDNETTLWVPYRSKYAPDTICHGYFRFKLFGTDYFINGTTFPNKDVNLAWYLGFLHKGEGSGWFYCSALVGASKETRVFFYNGTYFDVMTDASGFIRKVPQRVPQNQLVQFYAVSNIKNCEDGCCFFRDYSYEFGAATNASVREFLFFQDYWFVYNEVSAYYDLYYGFTNPGMVKCFQNFYSDMKWSYNLKTYYATNGTIYVKTGPSNNVTYVDIKMPISSPVDYYSMLSTALGDNKANGTLYFGIEGSVFSFSRVAGPMMVTIFNGTANTLPFIAEPVADATWTTADFSNGQNLPKKCGIRTCSGTPYYTAGTRSLICLGSDDFLSFCLPELGLFLPLANKNVPVGVCTGNFRFNILSTGYWLNSTTILKAVADGAWALAASDSIKYSWFLSRLRPNEGVGRLYCYYGPNSKTFFFDGATYSDPVTNSIGLINKQSQTNSQYEQSYFFAEFNEAGCQNPVCCWFTDFNVTAKGREFTEFFYNGGKWFVWSRSAWAPYFGEFNPGISACANYLSNLTWADGMESNATRYKFINSTAFKVVNGKTVGNPLNFSISDFALKDPLASGGVYFMQPDMSNPNKTVCLYQNISGLWQCYLNNGDFLYKKPPPSCNQQSQAVTVGSNATTMAISVSSAPCTATADTVAFNQLRTVCDPNGKGNTCGPGYYCQDYDPLSLSCSMGFCQPDYRLLCPVTTTLAPVAATIKITTTAAGNVTEATKTANMTTAASVTFSTVPTPMNPQQHYGKSCNWDFDCFTGYCQAGKCACSSCTKVLPFIDYNWQLGLYVYGEKCIPKNSTIGSLDDICNAWATVPSAYCGFGMHCLKCPEIWNAIYANATCKTFGQNITGDACPMTYKCGYQASCAMLGQNGDVPSCLCPTGLNLEENLQDCYGWRVTDPGQCSASCGNGVRTVTRTCDKSPTSQAKCDGSSSIVVPCWSSDACPIDDSVAIRSVRVKFLSKALSVELFEKLLEKRLKATMAAALTDVCIANKDIFEKQCCPGRLWPTDNFVNRTADRNCISAESGIGFYSKYFNSQYFSFYVTVTGDTSSSCCTKAASSSSSSSKRKRRAADSQFEQVALASILNRPDVMTSMTSVLRQVDPNIVAAFQLTLPTTTTTTTAIYNKEVGAVPPQNLPVWIIGALSGGIVVLVVVIGVIAAVVAVKRKRAKEMANAVRPIGGNNAYPHQQQQPMSRYGGGGGSMSAAANTQNYDSSYGGLAPPVGGFFNGSRTTIATSRSPRGATVNITAGGGGYY